MDKVDIWVNYDKNGKHIHSLEHPVNLRYTDEEVIKLYGERGTLYILRWEGVVEKY